VNEGPGDFAGEVDALRAERDRLRAQVGRLKGAKRLRARPFIAAALVAVSLVTLAAAVPGVWTRRSVLNTERYVAIVGPLARDPAVQAVLSRRLTDAAFTALDVESHLASVLGTRVPRLAFLAGAITEGVRDLVRQQVATLVASERFQQLWVEANRVAHSQMLAVLDGSSETVSLQDGRVVLNLLPIVNEVLRGVGELAGELVGRPIALPAITPDTVPQQAIAQLEQALGVDLGDSFGTIAVYDSNELEAVQDAVRRFDRAVVLLVVALVLLIAAALVVSPHRRRTLLQLAIGFAVVIVIERRFAIVATDRVVAGSPAESVDAVRAVADAMLGALLRSTAWLLAAAVGVALAAGFTGPYGWAIRARRHAAEVAGAGIGMVRGTDAGPAARWVAEHRDATLAGIAGVGVASLVWFDMSLGGLFIVVAVFGLALLGVVRTAAALEPRDPAG